MGESRMKEKIVLITGATRGIGRSIAERFLVSKDYKIVIGYKDNKDMAESLVRSEELAMAVRIDIASVNSIDKAFNEIESKFGSVDVLINNAGISQKKAFEDLNDEDWMNMLSINLLGSFRCTKRSLPNMKRNKFGRIINITSIGGQWGGIHQVHYAASKAGLINLTKSLAKQYSAYGICTNAIAPGLIETDMTKEELSSINKKELESTIPIKRLGKVEEVASLALFLASEEASYITGQTLNVNGGMYLLG